MKKVPELDGIRGLAIAMVVFWHHFCTLPLDIAPGTPVGYLYKSTSWFWSGVDLFFVLSGFLIGGILLEHRAAGNFLPVFYTKRASRIIPAYTLLLISYFGLRALLDQNRFSWVFHGCMPDLTYLSFTQNFAMTASQSFGGHFLAVSWSLAVEEQFYLVLPFLMMILPRRAWVAAFISLAIAAPILRVVFPGFGNYVLTPFRMDSLFLGVVAAAAVRVPAIKGLLTSQKWLLRILFLILLGFTGSAVLRDNLSRVEGLWRLNYTLLALLFVTLVLIAYLESGSRSVWILRWQPLRFLGLISYGLYLYHEAVLGLLHGWLLGAAPSLKTPAGILVTALAAPLSVLLATGSYFLFERAFLRMSHSFSYQRAEQTQDIALKSAL
jgi:peptidoglycan/LPS O-acetylase OafA/YrhL